MPSGNECYATWLLYFPVSFEHHPLAVADSVASNHRFASKPELRERLRLDLQLNPYNRCAFCAGDERDYVGYPLRLEMQAPYPFFSTLLTEETYVTAR
jgi:hypothetical protein